MSDKLQSVPDTPFLLPDVSFVTLSGRDCIAFAQAQFMSDVAALADGQWQWSGWLTPKGRVIALFAVLRRDAETLHLLLLDADAGAFAASLKRFVFRSKVVISSDPLAVSGAFATPTQAIGNGAVFEDDAIEFDLGVAGQPRTLWVAAGHAPADDVALARWRERDMASGLPRLPVGQVETWTPQQLSLDRLRAYSVRKGCYPGQEIVARTHFLGQAKRGLVAFAAWPDATPGADIVAGERAVGQVVCASTHVQLAVMPLDLADAPLRIGDHEAVPVPLLGGLER